MPTRLRELAASITTDNALEVLAQLAGALHERPTAEAVAAIMAMLDSGRDVPTGLLFKIGSGGNLTSAPTLRVWLLDQFGRIDPAAAAKYAAQIYATAAPRMNGPLHCATIGATGWFQAASPRCASADSSCSKTKRGPVPQSIGFLAAFDVSVAAAAWEAVPRWEQWLRTEESPALRHAAWVALDRLALEVPEDFLPQLAAHPDWLGTQPMLRASIMARADVGTTRQRAAAESYLQRRDLGAEEAAKFFELFPHTNATIGHTLASTRRLPGA